LSLNKGGPHDQDSQKAFTHKDFASGWCFDCTCRSKNHKTSSNWPTIDLTTIVMTGLEVVEFEQIEILIAGMDVVYGIVDLIAAMALTIGDFAAVSV